MEEEEESSSSRFMKWAKELGITDYPIATSSCLSHSLSLSNFPNAGGRGLGAARELKRGELILRVPKHALLTIESVTKQHDDHNHHLSLTLNNTHHLSLSPSQKLTVCLLYEVGKGKNSRWYPYLTQLPRSYDILASFSTLEIQSLQVNDAIWAAERATEKAESDWKRAIGVMEQLHLKRHLRTFKAWVWAFATISSRTLHIPWDDAGCLCPVGDLFNYDPPGEEINCAISNNRKIISSSDSNNENLLRLTDGGYEEDASAYCFYARRNYNKGEQVLLSYGTYTNLELLEHYGFLLDTNPNEKAFIPLEPEIYTLCSWPKDSLFIHQNGIPSFALLSTLRLWLTPRSQRRSIGHLIYSGSQLSPESEITVMKWIIKNCKLVLENLPTSIEKDKLLVFTIDKMQDLCSFNHFESVVSSFEDAACAVLESKGLINREKKVLLECKPIGRCLDKWRLAVQWRLLYKRTLADCVTYCAQVMTKLGFENDL